MPQPTNARRSVRMSDEEAWDFLDAGINGTLTTLRRDGRPVALPVWFVVLDGRIYVTTRGKKVQRVRHDSRCSFLVDAGERWAELRGVHLDCHARVIEPDDDLAARLREANDRKYAAYRTARTDMPEATRRFYGASGGAVLELQVDGKLLTWDNRKLGTS
jgi:nitroimidazol reductase NimA-like FMN-containing flavoprotein (pyridoxamine 5'-phosphate oxidase superfamily)